MFALIENGRVHELFETRPTLHPSLLVVDVSEMGDVAEGWGYDAATGQVSPFVPDTGELAAKVRAERDARIEAARWRIERHREEVELEREPTEPLLPLLEYRQALRDVPQQEGFPGAVVWPVG